MVNLLKKKLLKNYNKTSKSWQMTVLQLCVIIDAERISKMKKDRTVVLLMKMNWPLKLKRPLNSLSKANLPLAVKKIFSMHLYLLKASKGLSI